MKTFLGELTALVVAGWVMLILGSAAPVCAVPADSSYECDVAPSAATPAWEGGSPFGDEKMASAIKCMSVKDGQLVKPVGTPEYTGMYVAVVPLLGVSYTVEMRFRITQVDATKKYTGILTLLVSRKGSAYHSLTAGQGYDRNWSQGYFGSTLCLDNEWSAMVKDADITRGEWFTARLVVEDNIGSLRTRTYLNGKLMQEVVTSEKSRRQECLSLRSGGEQTAFAVDYIRWKNGAVPIDVPLDQALSEGEKAKQAEAEIIKKMEALF